MRFVTSNDVVLRDLVDMASGAVQDTISDMDFLETLAAHRCFVVCPWVLQAKPNGQLMRITQLVYDVDGEIDKARVLVAAARKLRQIRKSHFGGRFSL